MRLSRRFSVTILALHCMVFTCMSPYVYADTSNLFSQQNNSQNQQTTRQLYNPLGGPDYPIDEESYFTDDSGNILMVINVLGEVNRQGPMVVKEKVDFSKILALAGGLKSEANLKQVLIARQEPDKDGKQAYIIDLKKYYKYGDRSSFIALKPNDTIIIPEKGLSLAKIANAVGFVFSTATGVYYIKHM